MLMVLENLYSWRYDSRMELQWTNCPELEMLHSFFEFGGCKERALGHFAEADKPIILLDSVGFAWAADCVKEDGAVSEIYVFGPMAMSTLPEQNINRRMEEMHLPLQVRRAVVSHVEAIPVIHLITATHYAVMLHYSIHGERLDMTDVTLGVQEERKNEDPLPKVKHQVYHGTWNYEQQMLKAVRTGDLAWLERPRNLPLGSATGMMCPGDPLRQAKDEMIALVTLCARAAITGGMSAELAYTLSDYYIQSAEGSRDIASVYSVSNQVLKDYTARMHKLRQNSEYSQLTRSCMDYVSQHLNEKLQVGDIASAIGYADYYLTSRFKKETGMNLRDYINGEKIAQAKLLLRTTQLSIQEISEELNFSTASYFCSVFRKVEGISPGEYRDPMARQERL